MVKNVDVEVVVIEEILRDAGDDRAESIGHGEQQNAGYRRLVLFDHPVQKAFDAAYVAGEEEVDDEENPEKSQRTDDDDIEGDAKGAHTSSSIRQGKAARWIVERRRGVTTEMLCLLRKTNKPQWAATDLAVEVKR